MSHIPFTKPVEDSVPKVGREIAVGEDMEFQRRWWRFERIVWPILLLIVVIDLLGGFGRGWLANARRTTPDQALTLNYERIERASTPSIMTLKFGPSAIHDGKINVFVSDSIVKPLGAQRIAPQPAASRIGNDGITYTFPVTELPASAQIALEPSFPGLHKFTMQVEGSTPIDATVFVVP
jgi:hypothetical protein